MHRAEKVAYFSSEHGHEGLPLGGGLGILAGDAEKSAADLKLPMVAVGLLYRNGSFHQVLDAEGRQSQTYNTPFDRERLADYHKDTCTVPLQDRKVRISAGEFYVRSTVPGDKRNFVPLFLLEPTENGNGHDVSLPSSQMGWRTGLHSCRWSSSLHRQLGFDPDSIWYLENLEEDNVQMLLSLNSFFSVSVVFLLYA